MMGVSASTLLLADASNQFRGGHCGQKSPIKLFDLQLKEFQIKTFRQ